jgi:hypothetical protein
MSNVVFPTFPGLNWNVKRVPTFATMAQAASNGNMVRVPRFVDPMFQFECSFEFLRDDWNNDEMNKLLGFFLARQGSYDSFLLDLSTLTQNPRDAFVTSQVLTVDSNNNAGIVRTVGASDVPETIYELQGPPQIFAGGTLVTGSGPYLGCSQPNQSGAGSWAVYEPLGGYGGYYVHFPTAPALPVTANFGWYYRVIFSAGKGNAQDPQLGNDQLEFAALWYQMYEAQEITLVSARE